jgi:hypothetical protein
MAASMKRWRAVEGTSKAGFERQHAPGAVEPPLTMRPGWAEVGRGRRAAMGEAAATADRGEKSQDQEDDARHRRVEDGGEPLMSGLEMAESGGGRCRHVV